MSFARYPAYRDSGVPWLGEVPAHWQIKKISHVADLIAGFAFPSERFSFDPDSGIRLVRGDNVTGGRLRWGEKGRYWPFDLEYDSRYLLAAHDIVVQMDGSKVGRNWSLISEDDLPALLVQRVTRIRLSGKAVPRFVYSQIASDMFVRYVECAKTDPAIPHITMKNIGDYWITQPPVDEQEKISEFIENETAKIDSLVAEMEKLVSLLREKRQAVISHAVTKGLDPTVPMKDTGVLCLGRVPTHWHALTLRRVISAIEQGWSPDCYARPAEDDEWGVLKAGCVNGGTYRATENKALPPELAPDLNVEVRVGDVLMSRASGSPELVGSTALVMGTPPRLMLSDKIFRLNLVNFLDPTFFVAALNSRPLRVQIEQALSGGNGLANNLPQSNLLTFVMCVPPMHEQVEIAAFLRTETAKFDALISETQIGISLLQERRSAIVSATVTGQIDVRRRIPAEAMAEAA
jgi:type I restriction enzyme, S subunit